MGTAATGTSLSGVYIFCGVRDVPRAVRERTSLSGVPLVYENIPKEAILALYFNIFNILILLI